MWDVSFQAAFLSAFETQLKNADLKLKAGMTWSSHEGRFEQHIEALSAVPASSTNRACSPKAGW
jgi:hypothetical protein